MMLVCNREDVCMARSCHYEYRVSRTSVLKRTTESVQTVLQYRSSKSSRELEIKGAAAAGVDHFWLSLNTYKVLIVQSHQTTVYIQHSPIPFPFDCFFFQNPRDQEIVLADPGGSNRRRSQRSSISDQILFCATWALAEGNQKDYTKLEWTSQFLQRRDGLLT